MFEAQSVIPCHEQLDHMDLRAANGESERLLEHFHQNPVADAVGDVLKQDPTHETVEVLGETLVPVGNEARSAVAAFV